MLLSKTPDTSWISVHDQVCGKVYVHQLNSVTQAGQHRQKDEC